MKNVLYLIMGVAMLVCTLAIPRSKKLENSSSNDLDKDKPDTVPPPDEIGEEGSERNMLMEGAYFQGDIVVTADRNGVINPANRWPEAVIPYQFDGGVGTQVRSAVASAIADFNKYTCVRWVPRTSHRNYVQIYSLRNRGCFSAVGRNGGRQTLNLQYPGCHSKGTAIHEMMHATGFWHEQSRPDRDAYVRVNLQNVARGNRHNFDKQSSHVVTTFGVPYDYGSVMHYSTYAFSSNRRPTLTPLKSVRGLRLGHRDGFARSDYMRINRMYNCIKYPR